MIHSREARKSGIPEFRTWNTAEFSSLRNSSRFNANSSTEVRKYRNNKFLRNFVLAEFRGHRGLTASYLKCIHGLGRTGGQPYIE
jgi:hypothetical protein